MTEEKKSVNKIWVGLFYAGYFGILIISLSAITKIQFQSQAMFAAISALAWFVSAFLASSKPYRRNRPRNLPTRMLWIGGVQLILSLLFALNFTSKSWFTIYGQGINWMFGCYGFLTLYGEIVQYIFPHVLEAVSKPPSNPLAEFPATTQEVIKKGAYWVNIPAVLTMCAFFVIGVIGMVVTTAKSHDESLDFFLIVAGAGFLIAFVTGIIQTYRWQKWALQSGIPEAELKAAAKRVGLWWPKIKEE